MMYIFLFIFFSIVLESFPISSSGHIFLLKQYFQNYNGYDPLLVDAIEYSANGATACISILFFYTRWIKYIKTFSYSYSLIARMIVLGFIAECVTVFCYTLFSLCVMPARLLSLGFLITSGALFSLRYCSRSEKTSWQWSDALIIGLAQGIALVPGISRFGLTFVAARWLGFASKNALELSFLILWPVNIAAFLLGLIRLHHYHYVDILNFSGVSLMIITSGIAGGIALLSFYGVSRLIKRNMLWIFSGYTLVIASISMMVS